MKRVRCEASGVMVPKDKAIKRFIVRNIVDASAIRDIEDASVIECESSSPSYRLCNALLQMLLQIVPFARCYKTCRPWEYKHDDN